MIRVSFSDAGHTLGTENAEQHLQTILIYIQEQGKVKAAVSISNIKSDTWREVQRTAKLSIQIVDDLTASTPKERVAEFGWNDRNERAQADRCDYCISRSLFSDALYTSVADHAQSRVNEAFSVH